MKAAPKAGPPWRITCASAPVFRIWGGQVVAARASPERAPISDAGASAVAVVVARPRLRKSLRVRPRCGLPVTNSLTLRGHLMIMVSSDRLEAGHVYSEG